MKRLTEKDWKDKCEGYPWNVHPVKDIDDLPYYKKLAAYEDAEEQGLLLRLPCKVGDSVYRFWYADGKAYKVQTQVIRTLANLVAIMESGEFGKSVFLSLEEAEAKLKK